ncbi:PREDICTED: rhabdoid tumor deletion region protein 1-like [Bison bison bison]|uniref:Rhabdoid tumor deletion region protein 1-like n=1 Tax=Bison bison bison TaxID=43346 RepID=A0A6P3H0M6_BISBB|nr:PREDICTED: rhabdoid tumor deletion region protein 1-like [Bison bison bison]
MGAIGKLTDCSDAQQNAEKGSLPASAFSFRGSPSAGLGARSPSSLCLKRLKPEPRCQCSSVLPYAPCISEPPGALGIVNSGLIPSLVWKLQREEEEIQIAVSVPPEGKVQVWQHDVIPILVHLLKDRDEEVQANAAGGSPHPRNTWHRWPAGKYAALDVEATRPLLQLLTSSLSKARLNAIKALTMLAEAPEGRKLLQPHVATFRALEEDFSPAVQRAAQIAIRVIEWKP